MTTTGRRPTPGDPTPSTTPEHLAPSRIVRNLPPELGPNAVAVLEGLTFMYSNAVGDVPRGSIDGLVHSDTRFVNHWELTINGAHLLFLAADTVENYSAAFFLTNPELPGLRANTIGVRRQRFVGEGMHERIEVQCFCAEPVPVQLRLAVGTDFADILEIKERVRDRSQEITRSHAPDGSRLDFAYRREDFEVRFQVDIDPPASRVEGDDLVWDLRFEPGREWRCELHVPLHYGATDLLPRHWHFGEVSAGDRRLPDDQLRAAAGERRAADARGVPGARDG